METTAQRNAANWCNKCDGAGLVRGCFPGRPEIACSLDCSHDDIKCDRCTGLGYRGCLVCGLEVRGDEAIDWDDADGKWLCNDCEGDAEQTTEMRAISWAPSAPVPVAYFEPSKNAEFDSCKTFVELPAIGAR